jgi:4-hydroxy-3-polyprenylbenzoate decarboxylase
MTVFVAATGASGAIYADRAIRALAEKGVEVWATLTPTAGDIVRHELRIDPRGLGGPTAKVSWYACDDLSAPPASGSSCADAMLVVPCSMGTLGRIASGTAESLVTRAADVCLKERRPLVLVPRETPLGLIHLRNMATLTEAGAVILPACPHFYAGPTTVDDLIETVVGRALAHLGVPNVDQPRWSPPAES